MRRVPLAAALAFAALPACDASRVVGVRPDGVAFDLTFPVVAGADGTPLRILEPFAIDGNRVTPTSPVLVPIDFDTETLFLVGLSFDALRKTQKRIEKKLVLVSLATKDVMQHVNQEIEHVYFMTRGVASILTANEGGLPIEVATVGNEGFVGLPVYLSAEKSPNLAICQIPGEALRMNARAFKREVEGNAAFRRIIDRYVQALFTQLAQSSVCNRLHAIEQRCARWLLMTHDRVHSDEFQLTHEFLAQMLGVRRAGVTEATGALRERGLIEYSRGVMTILDRPGLERAVCDCYRVVRSEFDRLLPK